MSAPIIIGSATLYLGDCRDILPMLAPVDAVITDPPYEAEAHAPNRILERGRTRTMRKRALDFDAMTEELRTALCGWSATHCSGWLLAFCQAEAVAAWRGAMVASGASWRRAMAWVKPDSSPQLSGDRPAQGYESIAAAWCGTGRSVWNGGGRRGVFVCGKHDQGHGHGGAANEHPTQKPLRLMNELVALFSQPGGTVLDCFMGSGTTGVAALAMGRAFIGIEREPRYFDSACRRIEQAVAQRSLFKSVAPISSPAPSSKAQIAIPMEVPHS